MEPKKKLYRNTEQKMLAGVLAGLADYFGHDAVVYRLIFLVFLIATGLMPGVLLYVGAWIIIPEQPKTEPVSAADYTVYR